MGLELGWHALISHNSYIFLYCIHVKFSENILSQDLLGLFFYFLHHQYSVTLKVRNMEAAKEEFPMEMNGRCVVLLPDSESSTRAMDWPLFHLFLKK